MANLQKDLITKMVSNSLMTKDQGTSASAKVDEIISSFEKDGLNKGFGMFKGGFGQFNCFATKGLNPDKLTTQQKSDFDTFSKDMITIQKELVNKMVTYGLITKEQGDSQIKRLESGDMGKGPGGHGPRHLDGEKPSVIENTQK
jgi:hypothetical protein